MIRRVPRIVTAAVGSFALAAVSAAAPQPADRSTGEVGHALTPPTSARSTGQAERVVVPTNVPLPAPTPLPLTPQERVVQAGKVSTSAPLQYSVALPPHKRVEIRVRASETANVQEEIYRGTSKSAVGGCTAADGCIGWISTTGDGGVFRIGVRTASPTPVDFQLGVWLSAEPKG